MPKKILYCIAKAGNSYNGFSPDYPGCLVAAPSIEEVRRRLPLALEAHIRGLLEDGERLPEDEELVDSGLITLDITEPELSQSTH